MKRKLRTIMIKTAEALAKMAQYSHRRGWSLGTSGNYSSVLSRDPFRLAITPSGVNKGELTAGEILTVDRNGAVLEGNTKPSNEVKLHLAITLASEAGSVLHTHSIWNTLVSDYYGDEGSVTLKGYEMIKGITERFACVEEIQIPILQNSQNYDELSAAFQKLIREKPGAYGILLRKHGLYTWGKDLADAGRRLEAIEFLLEVVGRDERRK